jgi:O-acetyl-ADP-ribose deacetylase (regulator of RNase III)
MINYLRGNIFDNDADALVSPVNTEGVAGRGLAYDFAHFYPVANQSYIAACKDGTLHIGTVLPVRTKDHGRERLIVYAPTKRLWRFPSIPTYIEQTLEAIAYGFPTWGINSIAVPSLGCGLGGLNFQWVVKPLTEKYLCDLDGRVDVYLPA